MGREIRRVPANWEHPRHSNGNYQPLYDEPFETCARKWVDDCIAWDNGTHKDIVDDPKLKQRFFYFWQWDGGPPDPEFYRPVFESAKWYQVYETVSEGTPVTPPFATKEELIEYLVENGDFWDQRRGHGGWDVEAAKQFVEREWAPSLVVVSGETRTPRDGLNE